MTIQRSVVDAIGNTPLIRLNRASDATGCEILGKAEFMNPGQSVKDRAALYMIRDAEKMGLLRPGGRAGLQIITIRDQDFAAYRRRADFIQKYIFPGGMLPSEARLRDVTERAGLAWKGVNRFGQHYADTLAEWAQRFEGAWDDIRKLGFDERFRRLWRFYLSYCEAGFRTARTDVVQLSLIKA